MRFFVRDYFEDFLRKTAIFHFAELFDENKEGAQKMKFVFKKINAILLIIAILATVLGYIIMGTGDKTISPIILIIAYVVLFPAAILYGMKKGNKNQN